MTGNSNDTTYKNDDDIIVLHSCAQIVPNIQIYLLCIFFKIILELTPLCGGKLKSLEGFEGAESIGVHPKYGDILQNVWLPKAI